MSILERPYGLASLTESLQGSVVFPDHPSWDEAREAYNLAVDQQPEAIAFPGRRTRRTRDRPVRGGQGLPRRAPADGAQREPDRVAGRTSSSSRPTGSTRSRSTADALRARVGAGVKWEKVVPRASSSASPPCTVDARRLDRRLRARRRARAGTAASTACSRTASPRSSSSPRTASSAGSTRTTSPSCSGRSAAAAATSASSRRSSSASSRSRRSTRVPCSSRGSGPPRCSTRGGTGSAPCPTRSPRSGGSCSSLRSTRFPEPMRGSAVRDRPRVLARHGGRGHRSVGAASGARPGDRHGRDGAAGRALRDAHGPARSAAVLRRASRAPRRCRPRRSTTSSLPQGRGRARRSRRSRSGTWVARSAAAARGTVPSTGCRASSSTSASGWPPTSLEDAVTRRDLHRVTGALRPYRSGSYLNFEEEAADAASFYGEETYRRLRAVKAEVDPDELFLANHRDPARGSDVKTGSHGGRRRRISPPPHSGRRRSPGPARVSPVLHHQRTTRRGE